MNAYSKLWTPGPWVWHAQGDANDYAMLTNEKRWVISFLQNGEIWTPEQEANARLMGAAPELFDRLEDLLASHKRLTDWLRDNTGPSDGTLEILTDAHYAAGGAQSALHKASCPGC